MENEVGDSIQLTRSFILGNLQQVEGVDWAGDDPGSHIAMLHSAGP